MFSDSALRFYLAQLLISTNNEAWLERLRLQVDAIGRLASHNRKTRDYYCIIILPWT